MNERGSGMGIFHQDVPVRSPFIFSELVRAVPGQIISYAICDQPGIHISLFGLGEDESITTEVALDEKWMIVQEGQIIVKIDGKEHVVNEMQTIVIPANSSYELIATEQTKYVQLHTISPDHHSNNSIKETTNMESTIHKIPHSQKLQLAEQIEIIPNQTASKSIIQRKDLTMSLFALDVNGVIAKHTSPGDALVQVLEGVVEISIGDDLYTVHSGESIVMPANVPHALKAIEAFKMLLIVVKPQV